MMAARQPITQFGPDGTLASLPADFRACIAASYGGASGGTSPETWMACDQIVGSDLSQQGYCAQPAYRSQTYCACVNSPIISGCPTVVFAPCANSAFSYKPYTLQPPNGTAYQTCKGQNICVNQVLVGGSQNVVKDIKQQCGYIQNITNALSVNPQLAAVAVFLIVLLVTLMLVGDAAPDPAAPALPSAISASAMSST